MLVGILDLYLHLGRLKSILSLLRIASKLKWPKEMWALRLQCSLAGKAQEVCSALPIEGSLEVAAASHRYRCFVLLFCYSFVLMLMCFSET